MRIAAISDIHGNLGALEAVLTDIADQGVDLIVNLGDICSGPLQPRATLELLRDLAFPTIAGNHERQLLTLPVEAMGPSDRYAAQSLTEEHFSWLRELPAALRPIEGVLMVHGTVRSDLEYFLETVAHEGLRAATIAEVEERARGAEAAVILCGHTHIPRQVRLADGRLIVNPGSVGLPAYADDRPFPHAIETGSPQARYAIVAGRDHTWSAELRSIDYNWDTAVELTIANGRPDWARALATGRI